MLAAVLLKPQFLVGVVPMLLLARQWRALAALCGVGAALIVLPALLTRSGDARRTTCDTSRTTRARANDLQVNAAMMSNWRGLVVSVTGSDRRVALGAGAARRSALVAWRCCVSRRAQHDGMVSPQAYALAVMLPLLVSPHLHTQSLVLLFIPLALALRAH